MSLKIYFENDQQKHSIHYKLKMLIRHTILETLDYEGMENDAEVSVTFVDDEGIRELNKRFRNMDKPTDVLSFPLYENGEFDDAECSLGAPLGDIVISVPRAKEQAEELGNSFVREVAFLTVHSTLHLLGYDHERSKEDDEVQCRHQKEIIDMLGLK